MMQLKIILIFLYCLLCANADTVRYKLTIDSMFVKIMGFEKSVICLNNQKVGPLIRCKLGDTLEITVENMVNEGFGIHWHGIVQTSTPWMDGVPLLTQCPIQTRQSFTYKFVPDRAGTFWYHSHTELHRNDAMFGPLIVDPVTPPPFTYDEEIILLFSDFYNDYERVQLQKLKSTPFVWVGSPQALLVNGETAHTIKVTSGKIYLIRAISASALSWYNITIPGHNVTIVEVQGSYVKPLSVDSLWLNSGERTSVLLNASNPGCYHIGISMLYRAGPSGSAYLVYDDLNCTGIGYINGTSSSIFDQNILEVLKDHVETLPNATRTITIPVQQIRNNTSLGIQWTMGGIVSELDSPTPLLFSNYFNISSSPNAYIIDINEGEVIDVIFQNVRRWDNNTEQHSMHIHGHTFWVLGSGLGSGGSPSASLNLVNPVKADTATLPAYGWLHVRFVANNPGVWLAHCHVTFHMVIGMFCVFEYPTTPQPPMGVSLCGEAETVLLKRLNNTCKLHNSVPSIRETPFLPVVIFMFLVLFG